MVAQCCVLFTFVLVNACVGQDIRLRGGSSNYGRVEIFHDGQWGTVCDDGWDIDEASVACRQLGFFKAVAAKGAAYYGRGAGDIWLDDIDCLGSENRLSDCFHSGWGQHNCFHNEDSGVECTNVTSYNEIRLRDGGSYYGRVEILYNGRWGTVCQDGWGIEEATVVCRQLGFSSAVAARYNAFYGQVNGTVWLDNVRCHGYEKHLSNCSHSGWGQHDCHHEEDAGVECVNDIRLRGGGSDYGWVEIFYDGQWGTVCDDGWDMRDATVACRQLGFVKAVSASWSASWWDYYNREEGHSWLNDIHCLGSESRLSDCLHSEWGQHNCAYGRNAGVRCSNDRSFDEIRLRDGGSYYGRVEILHNGQWGTACGSEWGIDEALVVCHQLGFSSAVAARHRAYYGQGNGKIWSIQCFGYESHLSDCSLSDSREHICLHSEDVGVECSNDASYKEVRLRGGGSYYGRVEILYNGQWGTVCDDGWDFEEAIVVCRQLGFVLAVAGRRGAFYGQGNGEIWLDEVRCPLYGKLLSECSHSGWGQHDCLHSQDAGVECFVAGTSRYDIRLSGGGSYYGRVEIFYDDQWGTVCDNGWDMDDAQVVCRQLGFNNATVASYRDTFYGEGYGTIWLADVQCTGDENHLSDCQHSGWGRHYDCDHSEDVGVRCFNASEIRLRGGGSYYGRVEILYNGQWGTVCDGTWGMDDATVVCRQLGFTTAVAAHSEAFYGPGYGEIWLNNVQCYGDEKYLSDCPHSEWGQHNCTHSDDAGVQCSNASEIRLHGGSSSYGRVEILYNDQWGTVCNDDWDMLDALVACRQLGFTTAVATYSDVIPGPGYEKIWLNNVQCHGDEHDLSLCPHSQWGQHDCDHSQDAGVQCFNGETYYDEVRLGDGGSYYGRVEILYYGQWATVCDEHWSIKDATVVCRQLGFAAAVAAYNKASDDERCGHICLDHRHCDGDEDYLSDCSNGGWRQNNCDHSKDAWIQCVSDPCSSTCNPEYKPLCGSNGITFSSHCEFQDALCIESGLSFTAGVCDGVSYQPRLVGGIASYEGRLELRGGNGWLRRCTYNFYGAEASVVCKDLGFDGYSSIYYDDRFNTSAGDPPPPLGLYFRCGMNDLHLYQCDAYATPDGINCGSVSIRCKEFGDDQQNALSTGAIVGILVGAFCGVVCLAFAVAKQGYDKRTRNRQEPPIPTINRSHHNHAATVSSQPNAYDDPPPYDDVIKNPAYYQAVGYPHCPPQASQPSSSPYQTPVGHTPPEFVPVYPNHWQGEEAELPSYVACAQTNPAHEPTATRVPGSELSPANTSTEHQLSSDCIGRTDPLGAAQA